MVRRGNRPSAVARCRMVMAAAVAFGAVACAQEPSPRTADTGAASPTSSEDAAGDAAGDAAAIAAAEETVRGYFAVKGRAEDRIGVQIDRQAVYLTSRDVHPAAPYEAEMDRPAGITDTDVSVELSHARLLGDEVLVDFAFRSNGLTYTIRGDDLQLDTAQPQESQWDGTATLEQRDGVWLINHLSVERTSGSFG